jgi:AcrR family transcriptional regulator
MKKKSTPVLSQGAGADVSAVLLDAARDIFVREGIKGLSVRRLAEAAGCTTMIVYSRFNGKDGILGALFDEGFEKLSIAQQSIDIKLANEDRLLAFCRAYRMTAHRYPHHYALMLGHFSGELSPSQESQLKALATLERLTDAVVAMATMRGKRKAVCTQVANRLFAFCHGWVSLERMGFFGDAKNVDKQFDDAVLALVTEISDTPLARYARQAAANSCVA